MKFSDPLNFLTYAIAEGATTPVPAGGTNAIVFSSVTNAHMKWTGTSWMSLKRSVVLKMCSADFTPPTTGIDYGGLHIVPYEPNTTGRTPIAWTVTDILFRLETAGSTASSVQIYRSTGTGAFSNTGALNTTALSIAASANEALAPTLAVTSVNSGDKLAPYYGALGTGAAGFTVEVVLCES